MCHSLRSNFSVSGMKIVTLESFLAEVRALPGVLSVELWSKRLFIKTAARDMFSVRRRVIAWMALCQVRSSIPSILWELGDEDPCGAYDSMERAISSLTYRPPNAIGYPPDCADDENEATESL